MHVFLFEGIGDISDDGLPGVRHIHGVVQLTEVEQQTCGTAQ